MGREVVVAIATQALSNRYLNTMKTTSEDWHDRQQRLVSSHA
jgi:hypothetical protein